MSEATGNDRRWCWWYPFTKLPVSYWPMQLRATLWFHSRLWKVPGWWHFRFDHDRSNWGLNCNWCYLRRRRHEDFIHGLEQLATTLERLAAQLPEDEN